MNGWQSYRLAVVVGIVGVVGAIVSGQTQRGPATMDDLLTEMRGLRADLAQMAGVSGRMQVLVARLSLQEQRISALVRQLTDVQREMDTTIRERQDTEAGLAQTEEALKRGSLPPERLIDIDYVVTDMKKLLAQREQRERQLRSTESEVAGLLAQEQSRWNEFNGRIDELERALPTPGSR